MDLGIECNTNLAAGYRMHSREEPKETKGIPAGSDQYTTNFGQEK